MLMSWCIVILCIVPDFVNVADIVPSLIMQMMVGPGDVDDRCWGVDWAQMYCFHFTIVISCCSNSAVTV